MPSEDSKPKHSHQPFSFSPAHPLEQQEARPGPLDALVFLLGEGEREGRSSGGIGHGRRRRLFRRHRFVQFSLSLVLLLSWLFLGRSQQQQSGNENLVREKAAAEKG